MYNKHCWLGETWFMTQVYEKPHVLTNRQEQIARYDKEIKNSIRKSKLMAEECTIWFTLVAGNKTAIGYWISY